MSDVHLILVLFLFLLLPLLVAADSLFLKVHSGNFVLYILQVNFFIVLVLLSFSVSSYHINHIMVSCRIFSMPKDEAQLYAAHEL